MAKKTTKRKSAKQTDFFEIVNCKAAQPNMSGRNNPWMKLYTSLLDNDGFANLDDTARMLVVALWLYAARAGRHVFPADPKWLRRKIPLLNHDPDLGPLMAATDDCGVPTPFVRYCEPPAAEPADHKKVKRAGKKRAGKKQQAEESRTEESRREESRREQNPKAERKPARKGVPIGKAGNSAQSKTRVSVKQGISAGKSRARKTTAEQKPAQPAEQSPSQGTTGQSTQQPAEPDNPTNPDALGQCKATRVAEPVPGSVKQPQAHRRSGSLSSAAQYDRHDMVFGRSIFIALRLAGDPDNGAIDETTSFASTWHKIQQQSCRSPPEIDQLAMRLRKEAQMIARRPSARNKAAVWNNTAPKIAAAQTTKHRQ